MRRLLLLPIISLVLSFPRISSAAATTQPTRPEDIVPSLSLPRHPRLLLSDDELTAVRKRIKSDPLLAKLYESEKGAADALLAQPLVRYEKQGRRLLAVSREALVRITRLAMLHRISPDDRYLERAKAEMLAVAKFADWNPSHFLDTAEMGGAVAIGYDWLHDDLDEPTRQTLREAMVEKAIKESFVETRGSKSYLGWIDARMNWNQVCHGGLTMAALVVWEHEPELAAKIVRRAVERVPKTGMTVYAPDGDYPEGPGYWEYGTMYNVLLIATLRSALGTDFGMASVPGFNQTPVYQNQVAGPTLRWFNYADCRAGGDTPSPYLSWFARQYQRPDFAVFERRRLESALARGPLSDRMAGALVLMWFDPEPVQSVRLPLSWTGRSANPIAAHRSSWTEPGATYLALKGGSPRTSHAQMDVGTFVFDASAVRWACDLGLENYYRIESRGMSLWNNSQKSDRWKIFRQQPASHSVITINDQLQNMKGMATILSHQSDGEMPGTIVDLTPVHLGGVTRHHRGAALVNDRRCGVIRDELEGLAKDDKVAWSLITEADVTIDDVATRATLQRSGKTLTVIVQSPNHPKLSVTDISKPANEWDSPNPGAKKLALQLTPDGEGKVVVTVLLAPGSADRALLKSLDLPLSRWPSR